MTSNVNAGTRGEHAESLVDRSAEGAADGEAGPRIEAAISRSLTTCLVAFNFARYMLSTSDVVEHLLRVSVAAGKW